MQSNNGKMLRAPLSSGNGRGPVTVWRQCYVGELPLDNADGTSAACEVEQLVRDLFQSDEVEVEDATMIVCYALERRAIAEVGVYTTGILLRGYPRNVPIDQQSSWTPSVSTTTHELVSSEVLPMKSSDEMPWHSPR